MLNKKDNLIEQLRLLGLNRDESTLYLELLKEPSTHLRLSHATGINRTKVYRLADELETRSLITKRTDDRGTFLVAADPSTLEVELVTQEERLKQQRSALDSLLPVLGSLKQGETSNFVVQTYEGAEGFKQMLWHELKAKGEVLIFGRGTLEALVGDSNWAEKHRAMTVQANYQVREILNPGGKHAIFTANKEFLQNHYTQRFISANKMLLENQVVVYNDTVAVCHWQDQQKVGVEIINATYASMMRSIFEHYWHLATPGLAKSPEI